MRQYSPEVTLQYKEVKKVDVNDHISAFNTIAMFNWSNSWVIVLIALHVQYPMSGHL